MRILVAVDLATTAHEWLVRHAVHVFDVRRAVSQLLGHAPREDLRRLVHMGVGRDELELGKRVAHGVPFVSCVR